MRKKNIALDFTSLLDIIMILLFVVISTVGISSLNIKKELEAESEKKQAAETELALKVEELSNKNEEAESLRAGYEEQKEELEGLRDENAMLKALTFQSNIDEGRLYESLMRKSKKLTLICRPRALTDEKGRENEAHEVEVKVYSAEGTGDMEELSTVVIEHDFGLTREERQRKNSEMREYLYAALAEVVKASEAELYLISVQYSYGDVNFSQTDLDIIEEAIRDLERRLNKSCYVERLKQ